MARFHRQGRAALLIAETEDERALLQHARRHGDEVVLVEACYPVLGRAVVLPDGIDEAAALRVRQAFVDAAASHGEATRRRGQFEVV